jgi:TolB-like protein
VRAKSAASERDWITSVRAYKRTTKSLAEIERELNATYLVESSLHGEGNRLRVASRLVRVRDQLQLWSPSYDSEPNSMLTLQRELSRAIAEQIRLTLSPERFKAIGWRQTQNPMA